MAPKTVRKCLADMLEDLSKQNFDKFCRQLLDRREGPRVRRNKVEGKDFLDIADVLVSTFTEQDAPRVAVEILKEIECNCEAETLVKDLGLPSTAPGSSNAARSSAGPTAAANMADAVHFVDTHKLQLIQRVTNMAPILDELLDRKVIDQENYDRIRTLPTSQDKMRELYSGCLQAARRCKVIFFEILEKNEPYLVDELRAGM